MKTVFQTDENGFFVGATLADPDPLTDGGWLIPGGCVEVEPPLLSAGQSSKWNGEKWLVIDPEPEAEPEPVDPAAALAALHAEINDERDRRINAGVTVSVTGYGDIPVQGREEDRINTLALKDTARDLIAAGITDPIVPFRDADNVLHLLTPAQTAELADKGKTAAAAIYQVAWAMKDGTAPFEAGIPDDITDDQWWP